MQLITVTLRWNGPRKPIDAARETETQNFSLGFLLSRNIKTSFLPKDIYLK